MNINLKFITGLFGVILLGLLIYNLQFIVAMVIISKVISIFLFPFKARIRKGKIKDFSFSNTVATIITFIAFILFIVLTVNIFLPSLLKEAENLSNVDLDALAETINVYYSNFYLFLEKYGLQESLSTEELKIYLEKLLSFFSLPTLLKNVFSTMGTTLFTLFSILFITFFFLKEDGLFRSVLLAIIPDKYEKKSVIAFAEIKKTLGKYFIGILVQYLIITFSFSLGLFIVDNPNIFLVAALGALFNIIPYVGIIITHSLSAIVITIATLSGALSGAEYTSALFSSIIALGIVQMLDAFFIQPFVFSKSVKAHPLEIFLVIISSGYLFGILGMIIAIPSYSVIRIVLKRYFSETAFVRKITP